jgi:hypothetical protein
MPPKKRQAVAAGQRTLSFGRGGRLTANGAHQPTLRSVFSGAAAAAQQRQQRQQQRAPAAVAAAAAPRVPAFVPEAAAAAAPPHVAPAGGDEDADPEQLPVQAALAPVKTEVFPRPRAAAAAASGELGAAAGSARRGSVTGTLDRYLPEHAARAAELERLDARQSAASATASKAAAAAAKPQPATPPLAQLVVTAAPGALVGTLAAGDAEYPCTVGRGGVGAKGGEGDGVTPVGRFSIGSVFYRADRCSPPATMGMPVIPIRRNDGWCDDPTDGEGKASPLAPLRSRQLQGLLCVRTDCC